MKSKFIAEQDGRTLVVVFDKGEEVAAGLLEVAERHNMSAASFTAIDWPLLQVIVPVPSARL